MKKIEAIIDPSKLEDVKAALGEIGLRGWTVSEVKGLGQRDIHLEIYRGREYLVDSLPKNKIEVLVTDRQLDEAMQVIAGSAQTGAASDGEILVYPIERRVWIHAEKLKLAG
jgi:nitrogen regulatory protein P-II 1